VRWILATLVLLGSGPYQFSWAFAVAALADHGHHVSLHASRDHVRVVLHHHDVEGAARHASGPALHAGGAETGDHVLQVAQRAMTARRPAQAEVLHAPVLFEDVHAASAVVLPGALAWVTARTAVGPAPPGRTVVLRN
jgi:hypothetical protein